MIKTVETAENWGAEPWRKPTLGEDDIELFSEHGRVLRRGDDKHGIDYRSHWFVLAQSRFGGLSLLVKHGGGQRRVHLGYEEEHLVDSLKELDSNHRYLMLYMIYSVHATAKQQGIDQTAQKYQKAFLEGRLKKRRRNNRYHAVIMAELTQESPDANDAVAKAEGQAEIEQKRRASYDYTA